MKFLAVALVLVSLCSCAGWQDKVPHGKFGVEVGAFGANVALSLDTRPATDMLVGGVTGAAAGTAAGAVVTK